MVWVLLGAWAAALALVGLHAVFTRVTRGARPAGAAPADGDPVEAGDAAEPRDAASSALVEARETAAGADPWIGGGALSDEVEVVLRTAAHAGGDGTVTAADFVTAALCNRELSALMARAGHDLSSARRALEALAVAGRAARVEAVAVESELSEAIGSAARAALLRHTPVTLGEVLAGLAAGQSPVARWLAGLGVRLGSLPDDPPAAPAAGPFLWNDRVTPMQAVVELLARVFELEPWPAAYVMYSVHVRGFAPLGPFAPERRAELLAAAKAFCRENRLALVIDEAPPDTSEWIDDADGGRLPPPT